MSELLFDTPWWLPALLIVIGIALFITGNNRQEVRIRAAGIIAVFLAIGIMLVSYLVQTDIEKAEAGSRQLVQATVARNWPAFQRLLDPKASVAVLGAGTIANNRDQIISVAESGSQEFDLKSARITSLTSQRNQSEVTVTMQVLTNQGIYPYPLPSSWQLEWIHTADGMRVFRVTNLKIANETGQAARTKFPAP